MDDFPEVPNGAIVQLKGNTRKGRNRIKEHGEWWLAQGKSPSGFLVSLRSLEKTFHVKDDLYTYDARWIQAKGDENFEIVDWVYEEGNTNGES